MTEVRTYKSEALRRQTDGLSGASVIGLPPITGLSAQANNVETAIKELAARSTPNASETVAGIAELATASETQAGTDNTRAVHPAGLKSELDRRQTIGAWIAPALLNGWVNNTAGEAPAGYRKTPWGEVQVRGSIQDGTMTSGTVLFTLPAGYRPAHHRRFPGKYASPDGTATLVVRTTGNVEVHVISANNVLSFESVRFDV